MLVFHSSERTRASSKPERSIRRLLLVGGLGLLALTLLVQIFYPGDRLLPFATIDGKSLSATKKSDAIRQLNTAYANHTIDIYMGTSGKPVTTSKLSAADIHVDNTKRVNQLTYPWYMRLVPTSLLWYGLRQNTTPMPTFGDNFDDYVSKYLMPSCQEKPVDATLKAADAKLTIVPAKSGGQCEQADVMASIKKITPVLTKPTTIRVARKEIAPAVTDATAKAKADELNARLTGGVNITAGDATVTAPAKDLFSWLDFATKDNDIAVTVNLDRSHEWLEKTVGPKVAVAPGVSRITTVDFTETSRVNGANGQALDIPQTIASIQSVVTGDARTATAATKVVPPTEQYTRTYSASDTGLTAVMTNFAKDHPGTYGVSMVELDGKKRRASYNGDNQFVTASTYKLFVAYSLMKQIDAGKRDWNSNAACFNKMISLSDNACAESFLNSLGLSTVTNDIQGIGLKNSTFMKSGGPFTTANDLSLELGMIATGQNFSSGNQQRLISAMKANVYRNGIPAGVNGTVADKVGFMDGLLHDAAIVYGPSGTYVLAIMTNGSSWGNIADLAKQLDQLHAQ